MLQVAIATVRLTRGRGKEFATHATMIVYAENAPIGIRNIAKKRAPVTVDPVAIALPTAEMIRRMAMWIDLSFVFAAVQVTPTDVRNVTNQTVHFVSTTYNFKSDLTHQAP